MIYVVLPVYNEEENLRSVIPEIRQVMTGRPYKIVAIDDGSVDGSRRVLDEMAGDDLLVDGTKANMNIGAVFSLAISRVLQDSVGEDDVMVIMESDQTSECRIVLDMVEQVRQGEADVVIGSRYQPGGAYQGFPWARLMYSRAASALMRRLFPISPEVKDYTIFFRAYRVSLLRRMTDYFGPFGLIQSRGFVANTELLVKLALFTKNIKEVPFVYNYGRKKGKSKMRVLRTINEYFVFVCYMKDFQKRFLERRHAH